MTMLEQTVPATPEAKALGCSCPDLIPELEYDFCYTDCAREARCWIVLQKFTEDVYILAWDSIMTAQMRLSRRKIQRCIVHHGEFPI